LEKAEKVKEMVSLKLGIVPTPLTMKWSEEAKKEWCKFYKGVDTSTGMYEKAEAHVLRLPIMYAILDLSTMIESVHLEAAKAVWDYNVRSIQWAFGGTTGDKLADRIIFALSNTPNKEMDKSDIYYYVGGNNTAKVVLDQALFYLRDLGKVRYEKRPSTDPKACKPVEWWILV